MESGKNRSKVEDVLRSALDLDKAHYDISRISKFGILEMSRERMRTAYFEATSRTCPTCGGAGVLKSPDLVAMSALRDMHSQLSRGGLKALTCRLPVESANYLMNNLKDSLSAIETEFSVRIVVLADPSLPPGEVSIKAEKIKSEEKESTETKKQSTAPKNIRRKRRPTRKKEESTAPEKLVSEQKEMGQEAGESKPEPESGRPEQTRKASAVPEANKKRSSRRPRTRRTRAKESSPSEGINVPPEKPTETETPKE
jgi:ribonuclease E